MGGEDCTDSDKDDDGLSSDEGEPSGDSGGDGEADERRDNEGDGILPTTPRRT
jgi:hypothetical protein